jgi:hypothetical protein
MICNLNWKQVESFEHGKIYLSSLSISESISLRYNCKIKWNETHGFEYLRFFYESNDALHIKQNYYEMIPLAQLSMERRAYHIIMHKLVDECMIIPKFI